MENVNIKPLSVTELNTRIKSNIEGDALLRDILIEGEIGSLTRHSSGHIYITLKDKDSEIKCNIWRFYAEKIRFPIKTGDKIVVRGSVEVYLKGGSYQIIGKEVFAFGKGQLQMIFEATKAKLLAEGLFDQNRKIPIPLFPKKIAMITSPTGAVIEDMVRNGRKQMPCVNLLLIPARVQGNEAVPSIVGALKVADTLEDVDTVILARGGGSLEDLWCFNEEAVVRAVANMKKPIITGVGHETDTTLVDYASDLRAATPTEAIIRALQNRDSVLKWVEDAEIRLNNAVVSSFNNKKKLFETLVNNPYLKEPERIIKDREQTIDILVSKMDTAFQNIYKDKKFEFEKLVTRLELVSPLKILSQGYSVTEKAGKTVQSKTELNSGDEITTYLTDGTVKSRVI